MAASILSQIFKIDEFFVIFRFSKFPNSEKSSKIDENSIARQNGSVKMIAATFRRDSDQHPATKKLKTFKKISKTSPKILQSASAGDAKRKQLATSS